MSTGLLQAVVALSALVLLCVIAYSALTSYGGGASEHEFTYVHFGNQIMRLSTICDDPMMRMCDNFCSTTEAGELIREYSLLTEPSSVSDSGEASEGDIDTARTSTTYFMAAGADGDLIHQLEKRACLITGLRLKQMETLQFLRYDVGQQYKPHVDYFADSRNQRVTTLLLYLNDVGKGGSTYFTHADTRIEPKVGRAILWNNCTGSDAGWVCDERTQHAGEALLHGEKFAINFWFRAHDFR